MDDDPCMLTCYAHKVRVPQNDLPYLAFRLAVQETLSDIELHLDLEEESLQIRGISPMIGCRTPGSSYMILPGVIGRSR